MQEGAMQQGTMQQGTEAGRRAVSAAAEAAGIVQVLTQGARRGVPVAGRLHEVREPALRGAVTMGLRAALRTALGEAWSRGWQPADVVHAARRSLAAGELVTLAESIREELATYPRSTVDPRWWEQLDDLEEATGDAPGRRRRRPRERDRAEDPAAAWGQGCTDVLTVVVFVEGLPRLPVLGPLPGQTRHAGTEASPDVDDKLLTTVRRLLAQAEGTPYEAEAETFTAAAQSLMARHRIDRAMLEATDAKARRGPGAVRLSVDRPYEQPKMLLLSVIASANRCRALWNQSVGFATVVGHPADRRAVELLFTSLLVQATTAMQREGERRNERSRTRGFRSSFLTGFAARIGQRLEQASDTVEDEARERLTAAADQGDRHPQAPGGADPMAIVLRRRDQEVEQLVRELFPRTVRSRSRSVTDHAGWMQGRAAADRASLGVGGRLAGGASGPRR